MQEVRPVIPSYSDASLLLLCAEYSHGTVAICGTRDTRKDWGRSTNADALSVNKR